MVAQCYVMVRAFCRWGCGSASRDAGWWVGGPPGGGGAPERRAGVGVRAPAAKKSAPPGPHAEGARDAGVAFGAVDWGYAAPETLAACHPAHRFHTVNDLENLL